MASRVKLYMHVPDYQDAPWKNFHQAQKFLRGLLKGYYLEPRDLMQPRMPKWWWLQKNFMQIKSVCGVRATLIIIREKKGTRKGKSLYYQTLREKGVYPRERVVPPTIERAGGYRAVATGRRAEGIFNVDPFARRQPARQPVAMNAPIQAQPAAIAGGWLGGFNGDIDG